VESAVAVQHDAPRAAPSAAAASTALPRRSRLLWRLFTAYGRRYLGRHFHAVRLVNSPPQLPADQPIIAYLNHPSWWDPMVGLLLAEKCFAHREHYAPIDADALQRYRFLGRLGFFGVVPDSPVGAARFLRYGDRIMQRDRAMLWITAQGRFTDVRQRPLELRPGTAHLARRADRGVVLPIALEYPFWNERLPEAMVCFGQPIKLGRQRDDSVDHWQQLLTDRLTDAMDQLADVALSRRSEQAPPLLTGRAGVSLMYDLYLRCRAWFSGQAYSAEHDQVRR
jgi:1-acyl-sn-glycerol-3-phosphate acyltransferase